MKILYEMSIDNNSKFELMLSVCQGDTQITLCFNNGQFEMTDGGTGSPNICIYIGTYEVINEQTLKLNVDRISYAWPKVGNPEIKQSYTFVYKIYDKIIIFDKSPYLIICNREIDDVIDDEIDNSDIFPTSTNPLIMDEIRHYRGFHLIQ